MMKRDRDSFPHWRRLTAEPSTTTTHLSPQHQHGTLLNHKQASMVDDGTQSGANFGETKYHKQHRFG